jgi:hypothetical protein
MGNSISQQQLVPNSLLECYDKDGQLDIDLLFLYRRKRRADRVDVLEEKLAECLELAEEEMEADKEDHPVRNRRMKANPLMCRNDEGDLVPLRPKGSTWYAIYVESPNLDSDKFHKKFRKRFRTPYSHFLELVDMAKKSDLFKRWLGFDAVGLSLTPVPQME